MKIYSITLYPDLIHAFFEHSVLGRGLNAGCYEIITVNLRDFGIGKHRQVDDTPYGKKQGMLLRADVVYQAIRSIPDYESCRIIIPAASGKQWTQKQALDYSNAGCNSILISGYFEGIDARLTQLLRTQVRDIAFYSIGPYVLSSGDSAAIIMAQSIVRLLPGVIGNAASVSDDSYLTGLLEGASYTKPSVIQDVSVPDIIRSGDHQAIADWRYKHQIKQTLSINPDMLATLKPSQTVKTMVSSVLKGEKL